MGQDIQPEQGLLIGQHYALAGYGPLLMLLVTSPTVRDAMHQVIRFQQLTHLTGQLGVEQSEYRSALCYYPKKTEDHLGMLVAQAEISGTFKFIRDIYKMMGLSKPDLQIELPFAAPEQPATRKSIMIIMEHRYSWVLQELHSGLMRPFWISDSFSRCGDLCSL